MFRVLPPAGAPVSVAAVLRAAASLSSRIKNRENLRELVRKLSGQRHSFFFNSGKTALFAGLKALSGQVDASRDEVVIPAYTCYTVPAAIVRAGLKVRPVDIDPATMDYDYRQLSRTDFSKVLAVIGNNLFGIPSNWTELKSLAARYGVFLIDDAAQAMGLEYNGRPAGSHGDFGFYSLGRGKNMTTYNGGILVTDNDGLADPIEKSISNMSSVGVAGTLTLTVKLLLLSLFLRPCLYWIPSRLPFLGLGETVFDKDFPVGRLSGLQIRLAALTFDRLGNFAERRRKNAGLLAATIRNLPGAEIPAFDVDNCPSYLRLPVLLPNGNVRAKIISELQNRGISASAMYPDSIDRIDGLGEDIVIQSVDLPGARAVVERLVTFPTHPYVTGADIDEITNVMSNVLSGS